MKRGRRTTVAKASKATEAKEEAPLEPDVPTIIFIRGLQGSWSDDELKEKLTKSADAAITEYRVNATRSEVLVTVRSLPLHILAHCEPLHANSPV